MNRCAASVRMTSTSAPACTSVLHNCAALKQAIEPLTPSTTRWPRRLVTGGPPHPWPLSLGGERGTTMQRRGLAPPRPLRAGGAGGEGAALVPLPYQPEAVEGRWRVDV